MTTPYQYLFKLLLVGDSLAGKSALLLRFADDYVTQAFIQTIGIDFKVRTIEYRGNRIKLQIWDTQGMHVERNCFRGAHGVVLVYNTTNRQTFENLKNWLNATIAVTDFPSSMILAGTNCHDIKNRQITRKEASEYAASLNITSIDVSAEYNLNVNELFMYLVAKTYSRLIDTANDGVPHPQEPKNCILS